MDPSNLTPTPSHGWLRTRIIHVLVYPQLMKNPAPHTSYPKQKVPRICRPWLLRSRASSDLIPLSFCFPALNRKHANGNTGKEETEVDLDIGQPQPYKE